MFLPKTFNSDIVISLVDGVDSEDIDVVVRSYTILSSLKESHNHDVLDNLSMDLHPNAIKLYKKFANPPDRALAAMCAHALTQFIDDEDAVSSPCRMLAVLIRR